ncbi:MAG: cbb3-type cytochrome c oxidase N-terminal domain-containing protein [Bdellovibrionales bacterium]|jgi:cytochrome c oxidase cbb3-type subunit 3|nr:cbb3-type cytochrome c oxidase N-terminal domain-containing protein [Bdellovibrionales bacterium]
MKHQDEKPNIILEDEKSILLDHNYDGIEELDHPLPMWWQALFYVTIIFAAFYIGYYHMGSGLSQEAELQRDIAEREKLVPAPTGAGDLAAKVNSLVADAATLAAGKAVYDGKCAMCHGDKGQGLIGPNMADHFWIHGDGKAESIIQVVADGIPEKGMPPWGPVLSNDEMVQVVAYTMAFQGTNPEGAKPPEGTEIK